MELIVRPLFCLTRGLTPEVTDIMKVSSPVFGKMIFHSSAIPTQARPLSPSQPLTEAQPKKCNTNSLMTAFWIHTAHGLLLAPFFPWNNSVLGRGQATSCRSDRLLPLSCEPRDAPLYMIKMHWYLGTTLDVNGITQDIHLSVAKKSERSCGNGNDVPRQKRTSETNPRVQRKGEWSQNW